jgi:hypothetical protein
LLQPVDLDILLVYLVTVFFNLRQPLVVVLLPGHLTNLLLKLLDFAPRGVKLAVLDVQLVFQLVDMLLKLVPGFKLSLTVRSQGSQLAQICFEALEELFLLQVTLLILTIHFQVRLLPPLVPFRQLHAHVVNLLLEILVLLVLDAELVREMVDLEIFLLVCVQKT